MAASDIEQQRGSIRLWPRRKEPSPEARLPALALYHTLEHHRLRKFLGISGVLLFLFVYGFFFSLFVPAYFAFFILPIVALAFLVIWALPNINWAPTHTLQWLFYATLIALIAWPDYLAIALPGLPWITFLRLTSFPTVLTLLVCLSMSEDFRLQLKQSLIGIPAIPILLSIFVVIQLYSIGLSHDITGSVQKFIVSQTTWTALFFVGAYLFKIPGQIKRWASVVSALGLYVSIIAIWEYRIGHLPWSGHIPSIFKIEDESVQRILAGSMRAGTDRYRAQATFGTPLGLAEYLALILPFVLHFTTKRFQVRTRLAAVITIPLLLYADYLTDAKLGMVGSLLDVILFVFACAYSRWRQDKGSLTSAAVLYSFPASLLALGAAIVISPRLKVLILGGSSHGASTDARATQYAVGLQKFLEWPFGYGIGQSGDTLGFGADRGMTSIDTYYLSILLEYGLVGFIVYYGMFMIAIYEGMRRSLILRTENEDRSFLLPLTISLISFIVIKAVFSQQDNHPVVFMMLGALVALISSYKKAPTISANRKTRLGAMLYSRRLR